MSDTQWTKTTLFLFPMLGISLGGLKKFGFQNSYIGDGKCDTVYNSHIFLRFEPMITQAYIEFEETLRRHVYFADSYDIDKNNIMFVFEIPTMYHSVLEKFKEGKYSEFDESYVEAFFSPYSNVYKILIKHPDVKRYQEERLDVDIGTQEVWDPPYEEEEIYRFYEGGN